MKKIISKMSIAALFLTSVNTYSYAGVISPDNRYETFNSGNIVVEDVLESNKSNVEVSGNTLVNMFDYSLMSSLSSAPDDKGISRNGREITRDYDISKDGETYWSTNESIIKNGATYTFVADIIENTASKRIEVFPYTWRYGEGQKGSVYAEAGYTGKIVISLKAKQDSRFYLLHRNVGAILTGSITISNIMILKGDYYDDFTSGNFKVPSYFEGIKSVGEDEGYIEVFSSNSITENSSYIKGYGLNSGDNSLYKNNERNVLDYTRVKPNTTYKTNHRAVYVLNFFDEDKNYLGFINSATTFTTPENCYYITASININHGDKVSIVESKEEFKESGFRVNLSKPLRGLPNGVRDKIIKKDGKWVIERNIGSMILDRNFSDIDIEETPGHFRFVLYNIDDLRYLQYRNPVISNDFYTEAFLLEEGESDSEYIYHREGLMFTKYKNIYMYKNLSSVEEFREWLNDNPQTLLYQLKAPTYEPININPSVSLYKDITYISSNSIVPANIKITVDRVTNRAKESSEAAKSNPTVDNLSQARYWINLMNESVSKDDFQNEINNIININDLQMEKKAVTANIDLYVKSENMLSMSLNTNSITFDGYSGVEDMEMLNAVELTINSSLPYKVNAYLVGEIQNADKSAILDKSILKIKANSEQSYNTFNDAVNPVVLLDNQNSGNSISHGVDLKLSSDLARKADIYKTTLKFEVEQK